MGWSTFLRIAISLCRFSNPVFFPFSPGRPMMNKKGKDTKPFIPSQYKFCIIHILEITILLWGRKLQWQSLLQHLLRTELLQKMSWDYDTESGLITISTCESSKRWESFAYWFIHLFDMLFISLLFIYIFFGGGRGGRCLWHLFRALPLKMREHPQC